MTKKKQTSVVTLSLSGKELFLGLYGGTVILIAGMVYSNVYNIESLSSRAVWMIVLLVISSIFLLPLYIHDARHKSGKATKVALWIALLCLVVAFLTSHLLEMHR